MSILWNPAEATVVEKVSLPIITTGTQNMGDGIYWLKAGTPLDEDLAVANDEDAVYIVAEDFFFVSTNPNQDRHVPLVKAGYVDINKAEASAGITFADAAKSALETAGIVLVDGLLDAGGGGGGGSSNVLVVGVTTTYVEAEETTYYICDKTAEEMWDAAQSGVVQFVILENNNATYAAIMQSADFSNENYHFNMYDGDANYVQFVAAYAAQYPEYSFS